MGLLLGGENTENSVEKYNGETWQKCADSLKPINGSAVASIKTHVFVVDGWNREGHIQVYDINRDTWSAIENILKVPRRSATATIINNKLYISCGCDSNNACLSSTEVFAINGSSCVPCDDHGMPDLKVARYYHASVTKNAEVYFIGGEMVSSSCEVINITTREVSELPSLHQARCLPSAVIFNNNIVVMGGDDECLRTLVSVENYSFDTKQWTMMEPMTVPRYGHCATVYKGQILVIGGKDENGDDVYNIEAYDPTTKQLVVYSRLTTPRHRSSVLKL